MSTSFDLGGGGGNSFAFDNIGDTVTGTIVSIEQVQQTDMQTGQPATWDDGQPKMMIRVELATELRSDPLDEGKRTVYLKGSRKPESKSSLSAVIGAVQSATSTNNISAGGTLTLTHSGLGEPPRKGYSAPKQYKATYVAPSVDLGGAPAAATPAGALVKPDAFPQAAWDGLDDNAKQAVLASQ